MGLDGAADHLGDGLVDEDEGDVGTLSKALEESNCLILGSLCKRNI